MTTRLVLVCHAPTAATRAARFPHDEPIHEQDFSATAAELRRMDRTCCGPELRCRQTASALGIMPVIDPDLRDLNVGSWQGRDLSELSEAESTALHMWLTDPTVAPHGGESLNNLHDRVANWLLQLGDDAGRVVAITHPSVIRAVVVHVLRATPESFWRLDVSPLSLTVVSCNGGRWTLRETGHVP